MLMDILVITLVALVIGVAIAIVNKLFDIFEFEILDFMLNTVIGKILGMALLIGGFAGTFYMMFVW